MKRICDGCGEDLGTIERSRLEVRQLSGGGAQMSNCYHDGLCWDAHEITGELLPFGDALRLACEARMRETELPTFARAIHAAEYPVF